MPRGVTDRYRRPADLPQVLPLFPLRGAILLPRATLALNVFEPRYLVLVDYALAGDRLIGIVQPAPDAGEGESPAGKTFPLRRVGCAGRITAFSEGDDGRVMLSLTGIARFQLLQDVESRRAVPLRPRRASATSPPTSVAVTARMRSTGRACSPRSATISSPTISAPIGTASTARAMSGWSTRCRS